MFKVGDKVRYYLYGNNKTLSIQEILPSGAVKLVSDGGNIVIYDSLENLELFTPFKIGDKVKCWQHGLQIFRDGVIESADQHGDWLVRMDDNLVLHQYLEENLTLINTPQQQLKCSCGCWSTYGKDCNKEFHSNKCDLITGNNSF